MDIEDIFSAGILGLDKAVEGFDYSKGYKFTSFAVHWIKHAILLELANNSRTVRIPYNVINKKIKPTNKQIKEGDYSGVDMVYLNSLKSVSLNSRKFIDSSAERIDYLTYDKELDSTISEIEAESTLNLITELLEKSVDETEKNLIYDSLGINTDGIKYSLKQLGGRYNISAEGMRLRLEKMYKKVRSNCIGQELRDLLVY
jgi:RNA polymerase nonessential primary-like sigma factor